MSAQGPVFFIAMGLMRLPAPSAGLILYALAKMLFHLSVLNQSLPFLYQQAIIFITPNKKLPIR